MSDSSPLYSDYIQLLESSPQNQFSPFTAPLKPSIKPIFKSSSVRKDSVYYLFYPTQKKIIDESTKQKEWKTKSEKERETERKRQENAIKIQKKKIQKMKTNGVLSTKGRKRVDQYFAEKNSIMFSKKITDFFENKNNNTNQ